MGLIDDNFGNSDRRLSTDLRLVKIRGLSIADPYEGNSSVINVFGHKRLRYVLSDAGNISAVLVDSKDLIRSKMIVAN